MTVEWPMTTELNPLTGMIHEGRRDRGGGGVYVQEGLIVVSGLIPTCTRKIYKHNKKNVIPLKLLSQPQMTFLDNQ